MRDRDLVRLYWPVELRPAFDAIFAIDDAMADVVASSSQPALGAIRLAWWHDALERLDFSPPPPEPRLKAAKVELVSRGISGRELATLEACWTALLDEQPNLEAAVARGERLFAICGKLLGVEDLDLGEAGRLFARVDLARRGLVALGDGTPGIRGCFKKKVRPLTALAALAARDARQGGLIFEPEATPGRAARLLSHKLFGRLG